ncbi:MAG: hypothetical protein DSY91_05935, partial [Deltaproteobacteria bacterium]
MMGVSHTLQKQSNLLTAAKTGICKKDMKRLVWILCILLLVLWGVPAPVFSLYRWKDKEGVIHITDIPPSSGPYETIKDESGGNMGTPESAEPKAAKSPSGSSKAPSSSAAAQIPLRRAGNHFLVRMGINDQTEGYFVLDTGASLTVISPEIAQKAGITLDESLPILPVKTASGIIFPPVAHVGGFTLGDLSLPGGNVVVHDIHFGKGVSGLLGMDLLSDYLVTLDTENAILVLKPVHVAGPVYGGHGRKWWRGRFTFLRRTIKGLEDLLKVPDKTLAQVHISRERIESSITFYQNRL